MMRKHLHTGSSAPPPAWPGEGSFVDARREEEDEDDTPTLVDGLRPTVREARDRPTLTVLGGSLIGTVLGLSGEDLILGRGGDASVRFDDASVSRRHARVFEAGHDIYIEDLHSAGGTFVRGAKITGPTRLNDGDLIALGPVQKLRYAVLDLLEEQAAKELYLATVRDPATGAFNRRYFDTWFVREGSRAVQRGGAIALLLLDIDNLKAINDDLGHRAGDLVLSVVAASIQRLLRPADVFARYGGDEFVVACTDMSLRNGHILGERIRARIENLRVAMPPSGDIRISVSVGVVCATRPTEHGPLLQEADRALYRAKAGGRNRVIS